MRAQVFQDAVSSSTRVFGRSDVSVIFSGDGAYTNGKVVNLPALPSSAEITVDQAAVIRGYRDHEAMHVRITDTSPAGLALVEKARANSELQEALLQYCEDVRIEHAGVMEYPGMAANLTAVNTEASRVLLEQAEKIGSVDAVFAQCPRDMKLRICASFLARKQIGVENGGVMDKVMDIIKASDPEIYEFSERCAKKMVDLPTGFRGGRLVESTSKKGTHEAAKLAAEIHAEYVAKFEQQQPPQPKQPDQPDQQDDSEKRDNGNTGQGNGKGKGQPDDKQDGGDQQADDSGKGDTDDQQDDGNSGDGDDQTDDDGDQSGDSGDQGGSPGDSGAGNNPSPKAGGQDQDADDGSGNQQSGRSKGQGGGDDPADPISDHVGNGGGNVGGKASSSSPQLEMPDYSQALKRVVNDIGQRAKDVKTMSRSYYKPWTNQFNVKLPIEEIQMTRHSYGNSQKDVQRHVQRRLDHASHLFSQLAGEISGKRAMIRRLLELELQARDDRRWEGGHSKGRLHSVRLVDAINGKQNVYQSRHDGKDMNTALVISIDGSGSMTNTQSRMHQSVLLALALTEALERTGCDIEVVVWGNSLNWKHGLNPNNHDDMTEPLKQMFSDCANSGKPHDFSSVGIIHRGVVKGMRQRLSDEMVQKRFAMALLGMQSGTPFFEAVFNDLHDMAVLPHRKKIYMCITDGEDDGVISHSCVAKSDLIAEYTALAARNNIHMVGVGIAGITVNHLFKEYINVSGSDAYEPAIKLLSKIIARETGHGSYRRAA